MAKKTFRGSYDSQTSTPDSKVQKSLPPGVETKSDTFKITVKSDDDEILYENAKEPFEYHVVDSLATALQYFGAVMSTDHIDFLSEALKGEDSGPAVKKVVDIINDDLRVSAKNNAYQRVFNANKPLTEENITNAHASIVRNFMKTQSVSDETAIQTLSGYGVIPKEFTVAEFRANKGKR